jgi:hypothetical protein
MFRKTKGDVVKIKELGKKEFKPIEFLITIESEGELLTLWHKLNQTKQMISGEEKRVTWTGTHNFTWDDKYLFYDFINEKVNDLNLEDKL